MLNVTLALFQTRLQIAHLRHQLIVNGLSLLNFNHDVFNTFLKPFLHLFLWLLNLCYLVDEHTTFGNLRLSLRWTKISSPSFSRLIAFTRRGLIVFDAEELRVLIGLSFKRHCVIFIWKQKIKAYKKQVGIKQFIFLSIIESLRRILLN